MGLSRRAFGATALAGASGLLAPRGGRAAPGPVRIGVLTDMTGALSSVLGTGSVDGARMAVEDFGGAVAGMPVQLLFADHQNRPDVGTGIARRWFDEDGVDLVMDYGNSAIAIACSGLAREKDRISMVSAAASSEITGRFCNPNTFHWGYDTYMQSAALASDLTARGGDTWFLVTADYAFGYALEGDAARKVEANGGRVLGRVRFPLGSADMASYLLQARGSGAKVVGLIASVDDLEKLLKQGAEFGTWRRQKPVAFGLQLYNVVSIGVDLMEGVVHNSIFYWDLDDGTRAFGRRFWRRNGKPPAEAHAVNYSAATQYLKAVRAAGTKDTAAVLRALRGMPVDDPVTRGGRVRADGRMVRPTHLLEVKPKERVRETYDVFAVLREIPGDEAFRPLAESACPLVRP